MPSRVPVYCIGLLSLGIVATLYYAALDTVKSLSPQGCRMSWMSPSYILQSRFDHSWSPLAGRYSLWLYREVGWDGHELHGAPVLFIPGNAGSSHQVRSIASSATRQFYSRPYEVSPEFHGRDLRPLDFFAVDFNEDLSAFHGTTLDMQRQYTLRAIDYILSLYPAGTSISVMGHSMGGVVGTSLLPHPNISAIITMSTPHILPPARFDRRIDRIYSHARRSLLTDPTPILSLCGGATDLLVPSESCILPIPDITRDGLQPYRRTVFSSALEGSWTGVGHREMVWCHQVRWRVARAALELGAAKSQLQRGPILDTWLRDGTLLPPELELTASPFGIQDGEYTVLPRDMDLTLKSPTGSHVYLVPSASEGRRFLLYVSQGSIPPTGPHEPLPLRASVHVCASQSQCDLLSPTSLKLIPNPLLERPFPVPDEGSDESEGVVVYEAELPNESFYGVAVKVENADGRGWLVGGYVPDTTIIQHTSVLATFFSRSVVDLREASLRTQILFPHLLSSSLWVYRLKAEFPEQCQETLLVPLLQHTSHPAETHYFPLKSSSPILLHTHASAPFVSSQFTHGLNLTIYATRESHCMPHKLEVAVDVWATLGRWGTRLAAPAASWAVAIVAVLMHDSWSILQTHGTMPTLSGALTAFTHDRLPCLTVLSFAISFLPLPSDIWLGNRGEWSLAIIAPLMMLTVTGLVSVVWWLLTILMWPIQIFYRRKQPRQAPIASHRRKTMISLALICVLIFLVVPWQVGFLGCWILHFFTCASQPSHVVATPEATAIPLIPRGDTSEDDEREHDGTSTSPSTPVRLASQPVNTTTQNEREHLLLLMTWLLPLAAPVLAVWVRTLLTAGFTTPFDGDHNVLYVAPFLVLADPGWHCSWAWGGGETRVVRPRWAMWAVAAVAFLWGPRYTYIVYEAASVVLGVGVFVALLKR